MNRTLLSISSFDSSCATGFAVDLKTFQAFRVYGVAAITGLAAQNTSTLQAIQPIPMEIVGQQIEALASDMKIHGVKVGALVTAGNVQIVASLLETFDLRALVVLDPVMTGPNGETLLEAAALAPIREKLCPMASLVTANRLEAEALTGIAVSDVPSAKEAARALFDLGPKSVIITGCLAEGSRAMDVWYDGSGYHLFDAPKLQSPNTLGIGDTFSAALCALLAKGCLMGEAVDRTKKYIAKAIQHPFQIGKGRGPLNHTVPI